MKTKKTSIFDRTVLLVAGGFLLLAAGFVTGAYQDRWMGYLGVLVGVERSTDTIDLSSVQETYQYLKANYDGKIDKSKLIDGANKGLVDAAGDIHTTYLSKDEADEFNKSLEGDIGAGIGVVLGLRNDRVTVTRVLANNAGVEAGVKQGDTIVSVNGDSTEGWDTERVSSKIRGEEGTSVKLEVLRGEEVISLTVTRRTIDNPSVTGEVRDGIGVMTISRFDNQTGALARSVAEGFVKDNISSVIVDVRSDGGGYLNAAVDVAGLWLSNNVVVTQKHGDTVISSERANSGKAILNGKKTIVLVNGGTASASEILASALRDNRQATLLGEKTYGKGSVQQLLSLGSRDALLKVTVAHWYTPLDKNIDKQGLMPDDVIELTDEDANAGRDPQLDAALRKLAS